MVKLVAMTEEDVRKGRVHAHQEVFATAAG